MLLHHVTEELSNSKHEGWRGNPNQALSTWMYCYRVHYLTGKVALGSQTICNRVVSDILLEKRHNFRYRNEYRHRKGVYLYDLLLSWEDATNALVDVWQP